MLILAPLRIAASYLWREVLPLPSRAAVLVFVLAILGLPYLVNDPYFLRIAIMTSIFSVFAASWDFLSSYSGQVSFGHALFFGVGAYSSAMLNHHLGWNPWLTLPLGGGVAMISGVMVGYLCQRLRGSYLSLATLSFPLILTGLLFLFPEASGGELGVSGLTPLVRSRVGFYYVVVLAMLGLNFGLWKLGDSKIGLILHAIREDEVAARASGINTVRYKVMAFAVSALVAGLSGGLLAHFIRSVGPSTLEVALSFQAVIWGIFGGVATIYGPILGVFLLYPFTELLSLFGSISEYRLLMFALVVLLVLIFMPEGITPWIRDKLETECRRCKSPNVFTRHECRICQADLR